MYTGRRLERKDLFDMAELILSLFFEFFLLASRRQFPPSNTSPWLLQTSVSDYTSPFPLSSAALDVLLFFSLFPSSLLHLCGSI